MGIHDKSQRQILQEYSEGLYLEQCLGVSYNAIYIATAISAVVGTVLAGLLSNLPLAMVSGMGLNSFFVYTVTIGFGLSYANALVLILAEGLIFILLTKDWASIMPMLVTLVTFLAIVIMNHKNIRGAVLIGILGGMGLYYLLGLTVEGFLQPAPNQLCQPL